MIILLGVATAIALPAQTFTTLLSFGGSNGTSPSGPLVQGLDGNFYGTTNQGGPNNSGTVYKITPAGELITLYNFCSQNNCTDGQYPRGGLVQASDRNFYGTTYAGGINGNNGTVFRITPAGALTTLYTFCTQIGCSDGEYPSGGLVQATDGNFYGITYEGGANNSGTVYKITPAGELTTLYSFCSQTNCTDGRFPFARLVQATDGNFYGTTEEGGANGDYGTVFRITPAGVLTRLYSFCSQTGCTDGNAPDGGLVQAADGNFYGTTYWGGGSENGGTVYKITPAGMLTKLYSFCSQTGCTDGEQPEAGLIQGTDANFYGATLYGGASGHGTVFKIAAAGALTRLYTFCPLSGCADGSLPATGLIQAANGSFYGTTYSGGTLNYGTVFSISVGLFNLAALGEQVDYFGDRKADFTVWRPSNETWYSIDGLSNSLTKQWGASTDIPVVGDYDGDGKTDIAVWRPSNGTWYILQSSNGQEVARAWGQKGDIPVPGDYDGDSKTDFAVFRPSTGTWYILQSSNGQEVARAWGQKGDIPVPGDYDGDGKTDIAVWRPSNGTWYILPSSNEQEVTRAWGVNTDIPVSGDYDGDGKTDIGVWRPSNGTWYVIQSSNDQTLTQAWGTKGDIPVSRDYFGDGKADFAVWRPSNATWFVTEKSTGKTITKLWGANTDIPVNKPVGQ